MPHRLYRKSLTAMFFIQPLAIYPSDKLTVFCRLSTPILNGQIRAL